jgi:hypothetical protein
MGFLTVRYMQRKIRTAFCHICASPHGSALLSGGPLCFLVAVALRFEP